MRITVLHNNRKIVFVTHPKAPKAPANFYTRRSFFQISALPSHVASGRQIVSYRCLHGAGPHLRSTLFSERRILRCRKLFFHIQLSMYIIFDPQHVEAAARILPHGILTIRAGCLCTSLPKMCHRHAPRGPDPPHQLYARRGIFEVSSLLAHTASN